MIPNLIQSKPKNPPTIMAVLNFNTGDLSANRAGQLSKRQIRIAEATQPNTLVQVILMGHVGLIIGVMALILWGSGITGEKLILMGLASLVILSPFLYAMVRMSAMQKGGITLADLQSGEVAQACGDVTIHPIDFQTAKIEVDGITFTVPKDLVALLDSEQAYCAYYASHSKKLLSIEAHTTD